MQERKPLSSTSLNQTVLLTQESQGVHHGNPKVKYSNVSKTWHLTIDNFF